MDLLLLSSLSVYEVCLLTLSIWGNHKGKLQTLRPVSTTCLTCSMLSGVLTKLVQPLGFGFKIELFDLKFLSTTQLCYSCYRMKLSPTTHIKMSEVLMLSGNKRINNERAMLTGPLFRQLKLPWSLTLHNPSTSLPYWAQKKTVRYFCCFLHH